MKITVLGIDLAKHVFQLHGVDERGHVQLRKKLSRNDLLEFLAWLPLSIASKRARAPRRCDTPAGLSRAFVTAAAVAKAWRSIACV